MRRHIQPRVVALNGTFAVIRSNHCLPAKFGMKLRQDTV